VKKACRNRWRNPIEKRPLMEERKIESWTTFMPQGCFDEKSPAICLHISSRGEGRSFVGDEFRASSVPYPHWAGGGENQCLRKPLSHLHRRGMSKPPYSQGWRASVNPHQSYAGGGCYGRKKRLLRNDGKSPVGLDILKSKKPRADIVEGVLRGLAHEIGPGGGREKCSSARSIRRSGI